MKIELKFRIRNSVSYFNFLFEFLGYSIINYYHTDSFNTVSPSLKSYNFIKTWLSR